MRAILPNSNIEIEGDPAELAQLAQLLQNGDVLIEHVHRYRIAGAADDDGAQTGSCSCGASRRFTPWDKPAPATNGHTPAAAAAAPAAGRKCKKCGQPGHRKDKCPSLTPST